VHRTLDLLRHTGTPLHQIAGTPRLGIKCGVNAAFLVTPLLQCGDRTRITDGSRNAWIESELLRPVLRGEDLARNATTHTLALIYPHHPDGSPLHPLPPLAARWFAPLRERLRARADARHAKQWYSLFRLDTARPDRARLAWADIGRAFSPRLIPLGAPHTLLNTAYATLHTSDDHALALLALLNAPIATAILSLIAEPARGGYRRFLGHTVAQLPLPTPHALETHHHTLRQLGELVAQHHTTSPTLRDQLDDAFAAAIGLAPSTLEPIRRWHRHP
jgi:hypothetical protein